jgi:SAM-dependent methyltransferase
VNYSTARVELARGRRAVRRAGNSVFGVARLLSTRLRSRAGLETGFSPEQVATDLYRGILDREPDIGGLASKLGLLQDGKLLEAIRSFVNSPEFRARSLRDLVPTPALPDLRILVPERYQTQCVAGVPLTVYLAQSDEDIALMASLIDRHRYYDQFGVWNPVIDHDKRITAAIVRGLGARSCFELGCFTGPVISLLSDAGVAVLGAEVSHLAFTFAYPNVRDHIMFGDLLSLNIDRRFDVVLCMDVLEHTSPLQLDFYIERLVALVDDGGYLYLNAPMWGRDHTFGVFEEPYLSEWHTVGDESYWRHWPCDHHGWPAHGHLVWASPLWWERKFAEYDFVRDTNIEQTIHQSLSNFFKQAIGRRSLFVLSRRADRRSSKAAAVQAALAEFV